MMDSITVEHAGYKVVQVFAHIDDNTYGRWWYTESGKFVMHGLGKYQTEEELRRACEQMDDFMQMLERID